MSGKNQRVSIYPYMTLCALDIVGGLLINKIKVKLHFNIIMYKAYKDFML